MANDNQIAVKKRLIYAEDLFEPVDFTVVQLGGRSGGKTMAMYEQLFRKRVELAPTIDAVEVVHGHMVERIVDHECPWYKVYDCSECGCSVERWHNYCPNCGADMRERKDNG